MRFAALLLTITILLASPLYSQKGPATGPVERQGITTKDMERNVTAVWKRDQATQRYDLTPLASGVLRQAVDDFREGHADVTRDINVTWGEFLAATGDYFVAMQVSKKAGGDFVAGKDVVLFGEIVAAANSQPAMTFEVKRTLVASRDQLIVDAPLNLPPGNYSATIGLALAGTPRAMASVPITADPIDPKAFGLSRLILSDNVYPLTTPQSPTDPYAFGGIKVVPRGDLAFARNSDLWLFLELRNPGIDAKATPGLRARVVLEGPAGDASRKRGIPVTDLTPTPLKGFAGHFGLGIPLNTSPLEPGEYSVTVELTDTILGLSWSAGERFNVTAKAN